MLHVIIFVVFLLKFSSAFAIENLKIQEIFNNAAKYIKTGNQYKDDVIEKKSDKFNIKVTQGAKKKFNINNSLKQAKDALESGNSATAIFFLNKVLEKFPYHKNALIVLGNIHYFNKEYEKAIDIYSNLLKEHPGNHLVLENFLIVISQYNSELALKEMLKLYSTHKNYAPLLANLSIIYLEKQDLLKAKEYMKGAVSLDQNNILYIYNLAVILEKLLDVRNAEILYKKLLNKAEISKHANKKVIIQKAEKRLQLIKLQAHIF